MLVSLILYVLAYSFPAHAQTAVSVDPKCDASVRPLLAGRSDLSAFQLKLCDSFAGSTLNTNLWSYNYTWGDSTQIIGNTREHNFNSVMDESQVTVANGNLRLGAINQPAPSAYVHNADGSQTLRQIPATFCQQLKGGNAAECQLQYTSGAVTSRFKFRYGYLEGRFRMPDTKGFWPAFWLLYGGWPPETDIFELLTNTNPGGTFNYMLSQGYHYDQNGNRSMYHQFSPTELQQDGVCAQPNVGCGQQLGDSFHVFGLEWTPQTLRFYLDGIQTASFDQPDQITNLPGYIIINLGVGGWADNPDQSTDWTKAHLDVDWLRIWQMPDGNGEVMLP